MKKYCVNCDIEYDDAKCTTICPHEQFISDEMAAQKDLAFSLVGKPVCCAHLPDAEPMHVQSIDSTGMVTLSGMTGSFAPHILVVKKEKDNAAR